MPKEAQLFDRLDEVQKIHGLHHVGVGAVPNPASVSST
jgi:hypothetical protein